MKKQKLSFSTLLQAGCSAILFISCLLPWLNITSPQEFLFFHNISRFYVICSMRTTKLYNIFVLSKLMICMGLTNSVLLENRSLSLCIRNPLHMQSLCIKEWCSRRGLLVFYFFYFYFLKSLPSYLQIARIHSSSRGLDSCFSRLKATIMEVHMHLISCVSVSITRCAR